MIPKLKIASSSPYQTFYLTTWYTGRTLKFVCSYLPASIFLESLNIECEIHVPQLCSQKSRVVGNSLLHLFNNKFFFQYFVYHFPFLACSLSAFHGPISHSLDNWKFFEIILAIFRYMGQMDVQIQILQCD